MNDHYIVIAESIRGSHVPKNMGTSVGMFALTFPITIKKGKDSFFINVNLSKNKTIIEVLGEYRKYASDAQTNVYIMLAYDLDEMGELMAEATRDELVRLGADTLSIYRVPLTEKGYLGVKNFANTSSIKTFLYHQQEIMKLLENAQLQKMGIMKILSLKTLHTSKGKKMRLDATNTNININGTSTATFVHNYINASGTDISSMYIKTTKKD